MAEQIEKPWAVYESGLGKVTRKDKEKIWITSFESGSPEWSPEHVKTFTDSYKAITYFLSHQPYQPPYSKRNIINLFLDQFPSEKNNLELLTSQSSPKCTSSFNQDLCGSCRRHEKTC